MDTLKRLAADLETLHSGDCWIGYNALEILETVSSDLALWKAYEDGNTIWQLVNHISFWRGVVANRLRDRKVEPVKLNGLEEPMIVDAEAWAQTKDRFNTTFLELRDAILAFDEKALFEQLGTHGTYYANIVGCIQHDAYHLGQVVLLRQMVLRTKKDES